MKQEMSETCLTKAAGQAGTMTQWVICLLHKHKIQIPSIHSHNGGGSMDLESQHRELETGRCLGFTNQHGASERHCRVKSDKGRHLTLTSDLHRHKHGYSRVYTQMHHMHTHKEKKKKTQSDAKWKRIDVKFSDVIV